MHLLFLCVFIEIGDTYLINTIVCEWKYKYIFVIFIVYIFYANLVSRLNSTYNSFWCVRIYIYIHYFVCFDMIQHILSVLFYCKYKRYLLIQTLIIHKVS